MTSVSDPQQPGDLDPVAVEAARTVCATAGFTVDGVNERLGPVAAAALARSEPWPALRVLDGADDPLSSLIRVFLLGEGLRGDAARGGFLEGFARLGLLERVDGATSARLEVRPYDEGFLVVSDRRPGSGAVPADHVPGIGQASLQLARAVPAALPFRSAVDLGTGCGVQALHLAGRGPVLGTDTSARALRCAAATLALSLGPDAPVTLTAGDLLDPVPDGVDLLVANPPFVVGPPRDGFPYRDGGRTGDAVTAELLAGVPARLAPGGVAVLLGSWEHRAGEPWHERVAGWLDGAECDAWVSQRAVVDPAEHTAMWLRDSGEPLGGDVYGSWLDWFAAAGIEAVGTGVVVLRRPASPGPLTRAVADDPTPVTGDRVAAWLAAADWLRWRDDAGVLAAALGRAPGLVLEQRSAGGPEGWVATHRWLSVDGRHAEVDAGGAALVAALDGRLPAGVVTELLAAAGLGADDPAGAADGLRGLLSGGFLVPPSEQAGYPEALR